MTMSRRELFGWLRGAPAAEPDARDAPAHGPPAVGPAAPAAFSLDDFYASRTADRALPAFPIRTTIATPTTRVGVGPLDGTAAQAGAQDPAPLTIAPGLVPEVLTHRCLATSSFCSVCLERCPIAGAIVVELGRPRIDPSRCDGCGRCVAICPAPVLAFALVPRPPSAPR